MGIYEMSEEERKCIEDGIDLDRLDAFKLSHKTGTGYEG